MSKLTDRARELITDPHNNTHSGILSDMIIELCEALDKRDVEIKRIDKEIERIVNLNHIYFNEFSLQDKE